MTAIWLLLALWYIAQVEAAPMEVNVARNPKYLRMSKRKLVCGHLLDESLAVDGIWSVHHSLCATTAPAENISKEPFWEIDLSGRHAISRIKVMFRYDRLHQHRQYTVKVGGKLCHSRNDTTTDPDRIEVIRCPETSLGSKVTISLPVIEATEYPELSICEVAILTAGCSSGTYGPPTCTSSCGFCQGGRKFCDQTSGHCTSGCQPGYVGKKCTGYNIARGQSTYTLGKIVNVTDGQCQQIQRQTSLALGWRLQLTRNVTVSEIAIFYPKGVRQQVGLESLDVQVGSHLCTRRRNQPVTLYPLRLVCKNLASAIGSEISIINNDLKTQNMYLCEIQVIVCPSGFFGRDCENTCPACPPDTRCNVFNGSCDPCPGPTCTPELAELEAAGIPEYDHEDIPVVIRDGCTNRRWGENCTLPCNCLNKSENCYKQDGSCKSGCAAGYEGVNCLKVCEGLRWGSSCLNECRCGDFREQCNRQTGFCKSGCATNYAGNPCVLLNETILPVLSQPACRPGAFGMECNQTCNCRLRTEVCVSSTGSCPETGCASGFTGVSCRVECPNGTFGLGCQKKCRCRDRKEVCDKPTGNCTQSGCRMGFTGPDCYTPCKAFLYGYDCQFPCRCKNHEEVCDPMTGACTSGCQPGYDPDDVSCNTTCTGGTYGADCIVPCGNCKLDAQCNPFTGVCPDGCQDGFEGDKCKKECVKGTFGPGCTRTCNCKNRDEVCNHRDGTCFQSGCPAGKMPPDCQTDCVKGTYGEKCEKKCGRCLGGPVNCDIVTGNCSAGCDPAFRGDNCTSACPPGRYGPGCDRLCGECFQDRCKADGTCDRGLCKSGFRGVKCETVCPDNKYGDDCQEDCGFCTPRPNGGCNASTGVCMGPCQEGYTGAKCKQLCNETGNCSVPCGHCLGGAANCDTQTGTCHNGTCELGWHGVACSRECPEGRWGSDCSSACGHCATGVMSCNTINGECPDNACHPAYEGAKCDKVLDTSCLHSNVCIKCGYCERGKSDCDFQTGFCKGDCKPGYRERNCSVECPRLFWGRKCWNLCNCVGGCSCDHVTGECSLFCGIFIGSHQAMFVTNWLVPVVTAVVVCTVSAFIMFFAWRRRRLREIVLVRKQAARK